MTKQRAAIVGVLSDRAGFASAAQIYDELRAQGAGVGLATVYRTLGTLASEGQLDALQQPGTSETLYRVCGAEHHHHLTCRQCGRTVEVQAPEVERLASDIATTHHFTNPEHTLEIAGTCATCQVA
jgi:Fur family ferric uptake transcriptional regulator